MPTTEPAPTATAVDVLAVNTIRMLAADAVQRAKSGHPGMPMGAPGMEGGRKDRYDVLTIDDEGKTAVFASY